MSSTTPSHGSDSNNVDNTNSPSSPSTTDKNTKKSPLKSISAVFASLPFIGGGSSKSSDNGNSKNTTDKPFNKLKSQFKAQFSVAQDRFRKHAVIILSILFIALMAPTGYLAFTSFRKLRVLQTQFADCQNELDSMTTLSGMHLSGKTFTSQQSNGGLVMEAERLLRRVNKLEDDLRHARFALVKSEEKSRKWKTIAQHYFGKLENVRGVSEFADASGSSSSSSSGSLHMMQSTMKPSLLSSPLKYLKSLIPFGSSNVDHESLSESSLAFLDYVTNYINHAASLRANLTHCSQKVVHSLIEISAMRRAYEKQSSVIENLQASISEKDTALNRTDTLLNMIVEVAGGYDPELRAQLMDIVKLDLNGNESLPEVEALLAAKVHGKEGSSSSLPASSLFAASQDDDEDFAHLFVPKKPKRLIPLPILIGVVVFVLFGSLFSTIIGVLVALTLFREQVFTALDKHSTRIPKPLRKSIENLCELVDTKIMPPLTKIWKEKLEKRFGGVVIKLDKLVRDLWKKWQRRRAEAAEKAKLLKAEKAKSKESSNDSKKPLSTSSSTETLVGDDEPSEQENIPPRRPAVVNKALPLPFVPERKNSLSDDNVDLKEKKVKERRKFVDGN